MRILAILLSLVALTIAAIAAPDEELLGKSAGYPIGPPGNWFFDEGVWVGSFSNLNKILPHNTHKKTASPLRLPAAEIGRPVTALFNQERIVARGWPAAENRITIAELTY